MILIVKYIIKFNSRFLEHFRGLLLCIKINVCGGKCYFIPRVNKNLTFKYPPHNGIVIGKKCYFGPNIVIDVPDYAKLIVGDNITFASNIVISSAKSISIGSYSLIAEFVSIRDSEHYYSRNEFIKNQELISEPVIIESDVWIGRSTCILLGSVIKQGSVIGANSLIKRKTTDSYSVYVGVPVREIAKRE
jgi:acetyltransferase-like isoleucine patch superfamily enzyme